jgi:uncharacterized DUF497 family protein
MQFEWDSDKAEKNLAKHGLGFVLAARVFADPRRITTVDSRHDYGEVRQNTIGAVDGQLIASVTHTDRAGITRIISARSASRKERRIYHEQTC